MQLESPPPKVCHTKSLSLSISRRLHTLTQIWPIISWTKSRFWGMWKGIWPFHIPQIPLWAMWKCNMLKMVVYQKRVYLFTYPKSHFGLCEKVYLHFYIAQNVHLCPRSEIWVAQKKMCPKFRLFLSLRNSLFEKSQCRPNLKTRCAKDAYWSMRQICLWRHHTQPPLHVRAQQNDSVLIKKKNGYTHDKKMLKKIKTLGSMFIVRKMFNAQLLHVTVFRYGC